MPFLSIITVNLNNAKGLKKTLDSVASQTCRDFEHIIIDGASTDGSVDVIKEYVSTPAGKNVSYWVSESDSGIYNAMNKGIKKANGDYCLFLNSGDWLFDDYTVQNEKNENHTEELIVFNPLLVKKYKIKLLKLPAHYDNSFFLFDKGLNHQNEFIKTKLLKENPYNEKLKIFSDNEFNINAIIKKQVSYRHYSRSIAYYDAEEGISSKQSDLLSRERTDVLIKIFGKDLYDAYFLLKDYENGYWGILKHLRKILNFISVNTFRKWQKEKKNNA